MSEHHYSVAGRVLRVAASGELARQLSTAFMRSCCFPAAAYSARDVETGIRVHSGCQPPAIPETVTRVSTPPGRWHLTATEQYFELSDSIVRVRPSNRLPVDVWIGTSRLARRRLSLALLMAHAVHAALRRCALYSFHGAGLASPDGSAGVLVAGPSGSGKSALALRLAQSGWRYLGDDSLLLYDSPSGVAVCGLRRPFAVSKTTMAAMAWPRLSEAPRMPVLGDPDKYWLWPEDLFPGQAVPSMQPAVLLFPALTGDSRSRLCDMRPADALSRLIQMRFWSGSGDDADAHSCLRLLGRLAKQVRSYELKTGRDLLESPGCAADLIGPLLER